MEIVKNLISKVTTEPVNLVNCFRYGSKKTHNGETKPRKILVKFEKKEHRDIVYKSRSNLRKLEDRVFFNENLPQNLNQLRGKANALRKEKGYKYLWTLNGTILLRKKDNDRVININSPSDLCKII